MPLIKRKRCSGISCMHSLYIDGSLFWASCAASIAVSKKQAKQNFHYIRIIYHNWCPPFLRLVKGGELQIIGYHHLLEIIAQLL